MLIDLRVEDLNEEIYIQPRGLVNNSNKCFMNSVLQVLIQCTPFLNFLKKIDEANIPYSYYPILRRLFCDLFCDLMG